MSTTNVTHRTTEDPLTRPMYARQNHEGVSVNESAICHDCINDEGTDEASWMNWSEAGDVIPSIDSSALHPIDNPDARCNGCGAPTALDKKDDAS